MAKDEILDVEVARRQRFLFAYGVVCLSICAVALFQGLRGSDTFYFALAGSFAGFGFAFVVGALFGNSRATASPAAETAKAVEETP